MKILYQLRNSYVYNVKIYGDANDNVRVLMRFVEAASFKKYFTKLGLAQVDYANYSCTAVQPRELDWALRFLTENNTFNERCNLPFIIRVLQEKKWRHIEQEMNLIQTTRKVLTEKLSVSSTVGYDQKTPPATEVKGLKPATLERKGITLRSDQKQIVYG